MRKISFPEALAQILKEDPRFSPDAYQFVRDAMDFTTGMLFEPSQQTPRHVTAAQLLDGIRKFAIQEYGAMALTVLKSWGIHQCEDFGRIVFNLVNKGIFGKTENDSIHDFEGNFDFETAFKKPFEPEPESSKTRNLPARGTTLRPGKLETPPKAGQTTSQT